MYFYCLVQGSATFWREGAKHLCTVIEECHVIEYVNKFSGGLKKKKEFHIILF